MRRSLVVLGICVLLAGPALGEPAHAGGKGNGGGGKKGQTVTVVPDRVTAPISSDQPLHVCVAGFSEGNFVAINVPMAGDPDIHSNVAFSQYVDASGGFCIDAPPAWTDLILSAGVYTILTIWAREGTSARFREGPTTTFTVVDPLFQ